MAKTIGLSRKIKLPWLNKAVELLDENLSEGDYKDKMNEYLSFEIDSPTVLRKTREILMRIWYYDNPDVNELRKEAVQLLKKDADNAVPIHWSIMLLVYPVFADISKVMGRLAEYQDEITLAQLKQRLFDEWGERTTLYHSTDKIIATMKELGVIVADKPGRYVVCRRHIKDSSTTNILIRAAMQTDGGSYYSLDGLKEFAVLFPFDYKLDKESIYQDDSFDVGSFGGVVNVSVR